MKYQKLRNYVRGQGMTLKQYAKDVLKISPQACDYKYSGKSKFTLEQMEITRKYFKLTNKQVVDFFLED